MHAASVVPVFNGEHYHIWAVKMRFFLRSLGLWNVVQTDVDPTPLNGNPTIAQMKAFEEEKLKEPLPVFIMEFQIMSSPR